MKTSRTAVALVVALTAWGVGGSSSVLATGPTCCAPVPDEAVSWWRGEGDGNDSNGTNHATQLNAISFVAGKAGLGFGCNGSSSFLRVPDAVSLRFTNAMTVEAWIFPLSWGGRPREIVSKWEGGFNQRSYTFSINSAGNVYFHVSSDGGFFNTSTVQTPTIVSTNQWSHVAGVYDGATLKIYLNGTLQSSVAWTNRIFAGTAPLIIGSTLNSGSYFHGTIDEPTVYRRALTRQEILSIYESGSAGKCTAGGTAPSIAQHPQGVIVNEGGTALLTVSASGSEPLAYQWLKDGVDVAGAMAPSLVISNVQLSHAGLYSVVVSNAFGTATSSNAVLAVIVPDDCVPRPPGLVSWWKAEGNASDSASTNHGALLNGASFAPGKVGQAFSFGGNGAHVRVPNSAALQVTNGLTIEAWVYPTVGGIYREIVSKWDEQGTQNSYTTALHPDGRAYLAVSPNGSPWSIVMVISTNAVPLNEWTYVAGTYDGSALRIYVNGVLENQQAHTGGIFAGNRDLGIGGYVGGFGTGGVGSPFLGRIDEPSLYNRALAASEIESIFSAGSAGKCISGGTAPSITQHPQDLMVNEGGTALFTVSASGSEPLAYQWLKDGADVAGAMAPSLVISNVQTSHAGLYSVVVSNAFGVATSSNAVLAVNRRPIADASATLALVISPNNTNAVVVLDGSRSFDPDGDALTYLWRAADSTPLATGVVALVTLPVGAHAIELVVSDGLASASDWVNIEVLTSAQAVEQLVEVVTTDVSRSRPLAALLSAAIGSIDRENPVAAINQLQAFQNQVQAQVAPLDPELAESLIAAAQEVIDSLSGEGSGESSRIVSLERKADGKTRVKVAGKHGRIHVIQVSSNLVDWENAGVAEDAGDGAFEFDDAGSAKPAARFYRVYSP
jgi:hypothetical protein